jgi:hypothetical protein
MFAVETNVLTTLTDGDHVAWTLSDPIHEAFSRKPEHVVATVYDAEGKAYRSKASQEFNAKWGSISR